MNCITKFKIRYYKKIISAAFFSLLFVNVLNAQNFDWAKREGQAAYDYGYGIANDSLGNVYVAGKYELNANFSGTILPNQGNHDIYLAKYSPAGALIWIRTAGSILGDYAHTLSCDGAYLYVGGEIEGFGNIIKFSGSPITLTSKGVNDAFLAKYDLNGNLLWANRAGGIYNDEALGITYDKAGNVFVCGFFNTSAVFGTTTVTGYGLNDIYVAKYNKDGVFQWVRTAGSPGRDEAKGIKCDAAGNVYVCGMYKNGAVFGSQTLTSPNGYFNSFLAKYTTDGTLSWVKTAGGDYDDVGWALTIDNNNKIFVTGEFNAYAHFDGIAITTTGSSDIFVACYDVSGNIQWVRKAGGRLIDRAKGIGCDGTNLYITGNYSLSANFGTYSLTGTDSSEIFMAKMNNAGDFQWVIGVDGPADSLEFLGNETGNAICAEPSGNVYATGSVLNGGVFGNYSFLPYSRTDAFICKISQNIVTPKSSQPSSITVMETQPAAFSVSATGSLPINYQWQRNGINIPGANAAAYSITNTQLSQAGQYRTVVTNIYGSDTSSAASLTVIPYVAPSVCTASGTITRDFWANVTGASVSKVPVNTVPTSSSQLTIFEGPTKAGDNYASRIRGYICPPLTGSYIFWIASDDNSELWLSTNDMPANKVKIASVTGYCAPREWTKYPSQQSVPINLNAGTKYYIEALHKEGTLGDNLSVGWQLPFGTLERPIPGSRLSPFGLPLTASITSPINSSSFTAGSNITIQAAASGGTSTIQKVEFYAGLVKLGESAVSPYNFIWNNAAAGIYALTAKVTDSGNNNAVSAISNISVNSSNQLTSSIVSPINNSSFNAGSNITIQAAASGGTGSIQKVEFFAGSQKLGESTVSPYNFVWNNAPAGIYALTAKATDSIGNTAVSAIINISVNSPNQLTAAVTSPANNSSFIEGSNITISASASGGTGTIQKVEFFAGSAKLGESTSSPYNFSWNNVTAGIYELTAKAADSAGNTAVSAIINISVNNQTAVNITSPAQNTSYPSPANITINASVTGGGSISKVEFFQDTIKIGEDITAPYSFTWMNATSGNYTLKAKATGNNNQTSVSPAVNVTVTTCPTPIIIPLGPTTICSGSVTLQTNNGSASMYQWKKDGADITGAVNSTYTAAVSGSYQVKIIQGSCISWSGPTAVKIQNGLSASITPGGSTTFCLGGNVKLYANTCSGYTYKWKKDGFAVTGAAGAVYIASEAGNYQLQVTQAGVNAWSATVKVTVNNCKGLEINSKADSGQVQTISGLTDSINIFQMKVYPNPNTGLFTININMAGAHEEKVSIRILNTLGQEVYNKGYEIKDKYIRENVELNGSLPTGIYTLSVQIGNKVENTIIILSR